MSTTYNRVRSLEAIGLLIGYTVILDPFKLPYSLTAIILIQAEGWHFVEAEQKIAKHVEVMAIYDISRDNDIAVVTKFKDRPSLNAFVKNLLATLHIKTTVANLAIGVVKEDYRIKLGYAKNDVNRTCKEEHA